MRAFLQGAPEELKEIVALALIVLGVSILGAAAGAFVAAALA